MDEAGWVPIAVDTFVPPARLGALMVARRNERGLEVAEMAQRSNGMFTPTYLENVERGRVHLDERVTDYLVGLYSVEAGPVIPERSELILDLDHHELGVGDRMVSIDSLHAEDVLDRYVSLVYLLRGAEPGSDLVLRDADIDVLATALGYSPSDVRREVTTLIVAPESVQRAKRARTITMVAAAGLLVAIIAMGAIVLLARGGPESTEVLGASQAAVVTTGLPAQLGAAAEASIDLDFRALLPDWDIRYANDDPDFRGITLSADKTITIHVEPDASVEAVASVLMHEVGHAIDLEYLDDEQRSTWIAMRSMPATWWPENGLNDFAVGAGDFAEAVASVTASSPSSSVYGEFTEEQLDFVADILASS